MSEEIDLQRYIAALRHRWWIVALITIVALAIAFALSAAQPRHYQATATLIAKGPEEVWNFGTGVADLINVRRDYQREFLPLVKSNTVANNAAGKLQQAGQTGVTGESLRNAVSVRTGDALTLLVVATADTPQQAADMANAWAAAAVERINQLYGASLDPSRWNEELKQAAQTLQEMDDLVESVRAQTGLYATGDALDENAFVSATHQQVALTNQRLAEYRADLENLRYLQQQLADAEPGTDLTVLPWELLDGPVLSHRGVITSATALTLLDDPAALTQLLQQEEASLSAASEQLQQQSQQLQARLAADWKMYGQAIRLRNLANDTHTRMARKAEETQIRAGVDPGRLILADEAVPPSSPVQTRRMAQLAVAGVLGLILGVLAALWVDFRLT